MKNSILWFDCLTGGHLLFRFEIAFLIWCKMFSYQMHAWFFKCCVALQATPYFTLEKCLQISFFLYFSSRHWSTYQVHEWFLSVVQHYKQVTPYLTQEICLQINFSSRHWPLHFPASVREQDGSKAGIASQRPVPAQPVGAPVPARPWNCHRNTAHGLVQSSHRCLRKCSSLNKYLLN